MIIEMKRIPNDQIKYFEIENCKFKKYTNLNTLVHSSLNKN